MGLHPSSKLHQDLAKISETTAKGATLKYLEPQDLMSATRVAFQRSNKTSLVSRTQTRSLTKASTKLASILEIKLQRSKTLI